MKKLIFILPLLYYSCTDDIVADIDALQTENVEQDSQIDSLLTIITTQQEYIDSINNVQNAYIDSLISESSISDSLLQIYTDSLNTIQNTLNADQQAYIDSLINISSISDSLLQVYTDSLNTVQNTLNADQQAYIDSLINLGNVSDSLLQVYTDSLNTVQNAYIDSLNGVQQTLIDALISTQPNTGDNYVRIDSIQICWDNVSATLGTNVSVIFPQPFSELPSIIATNQTTANNTGQSGVNVLDLSNTGATFYGSAVIIHYYAIGKWK